MSRLDTLPTELLIIIFKHCSVYDLARLNRVCRRFYEILHADSIWMSIDKPLVTNQDSERFRERCNALLYASNKWRVSHNWQHGRYCERMVFSKAENIISCKMLLRMTNEELWLCAGKILLSFDRTRSVFDIKQNCSRFHVVEKGCDLSTFVLTKDFIVTASRCGNVKFLPYRGYKCFWEKYSDDTNFMEKYNHNFDINDMDVVSNFIITGSDDHRVKIQRLPGIAEEIAYSATCLSMEDRVWSVAANPTGTILAIGTSANNNPRSLHMVDIKECRKMHDYIRFNFLKNNGISSMVWESPYILLTCGYDKNIRKWDIRTGSCVSAWPDPTDSVLYCISTDYRHTMVTGAQRNTAVLWDQRQNKYVQRYFMGSSDYNYESPIYSLQFDSSQLYCATNRHLVERRFADQTKRWFDCEESYGL